MWYPTNKSYTAIAKIAKKDIPIIKVGTNMGPDTFVSDFMGAMYWLNKTVPRVKIHPIFEGRIEAGYHFFKPNMVTVVKSKLNATLPYPCIDICSKFVKRVVHRFYGEDLTIAKGFIPKGTVYYLNSRGDGVAEQICLTEMIKL